MAAMVLQMNVLLLLLLALLPQLFLVLGIAVVAGLQTAATAAAAN